MTVCTCSFPGSPPVELLYSISPLPHLPPGDCCFCNLWVTPAPIPSPGTCSEMLSLAPFHLPLPQPRWGSQLLALAPRLLARLAPLWDSTLPHWHLHSDPPKSPTEGLTPKEMTQPPCSLGLSDPPGEVKLQVPAKQGHKERKNGGEVLYFLC